MSRFQLRFVPNICTRAARYAIAVTNVRSTSPLSQEIRVRVP
jgi:hypothetical protein